MQSRKDLNSTKKMVMLLLLADGQCYLVTVDTNEFLSLSTLEPGHFECFYFEAVIPVRQLHHLKGYAH